MAQFLDKTSRTVVNAQTYGFIVVGFSNADYICDGTADNVQIQQAIDFASTNGINTVWIRDEGTYDIQTSIKLRDYTHLLGSSWEVILKLADNKSTAVLENVDRTNGNRSIILENFTIDGNRDNQSNMTDGIVTIIQGASIARHTYRKLYAKNSSGKGLYMQQADHGLITECRVENVRTNGVDFFVCNRGTIEKNFVTDVTENVGIIVNRNSSFNVIRGNHVTRTSDDGIQIRGFSTGTEFSEHNIIIDNIVEDIGLGPNLIADGSGSRGQGIFLNESGNRRNQVIGNQIYRSGINGIEVTVNATEMVISNNIVCFAGYRADGSVGKDALGEGVGISCNNNGSKHIITGNKIFSCYRNGITVGDNCTVTGSECFDNNTKNSATGYGINFGGDCVITSNRCYDTKLAGSRTQKYGLQSSGTNNVIIGNHSYDNETSDYNVTGSNRIFHNDSTNIFSTDIDARGKNVNGLKIQAVTSGGGIGGYMTQETGDVLAFYANRATIPVNDVLRWYVKNDGSVYTLVGGLTGGTLSKLYYRELQTDTISERTGAAGVTIDGALIKDNKFGDNMTATASTLSWFSGTPSAQRTSAGAVSATATYGATEQTMIQTVYDAMRAYHLLT